MDMLKEQTVLITGATDGLGKRVAGELADRGATVLVHGRDAGRAEATVREISENTGVSANALHPATLMDTKMVRETFGSAMSSVEEGVEATVYLATSPEVEGVTGRYFDGKSESRADGQAYDGKVRERLRQLSEKLAGL